MNSKDTIGFRSGTALILAVVLTTLLAIVGMMYVMGARVDRIATSAISENKELKLAIDTILAKISQTLILDTPGIAGAEYYDYPGEKDTWLANLEPYYELDVNGVPTKYKWGQISDLTDYMKIRAWKTRDVLVDQLGRREVIDEYPEIILDGQGRLWQNDNLRANADADGDGIADSKWIELNDMSSGKGKPIYAAIRIIDNGGMLNVNTAEQFDANDPNSKAIDGSSQLQINLEEIVKVQSSTTDTLLKLNEGETVPVMVKGRFGNVGTAVTWDDWEKDVVWRFGLPNGEYMPFDISDELELRNRYCIDSKMVTRLESLWDNSVSGRNTMSAVYAAIPGETDDSLDDWERIFVNPTDPNFDFRHILTTNNMDRVFDPDGEKMLNINLDVDDPNIQTDLGFDANEPLAVNIYRKLIKCIDPNLTARADERLKQAQRQIAQLAVNIVDLRDNDSDVTSFSPYVSVDSNAVDEFFYGIEPYPVITKVGIAIDPCDPEYGQNYYAVELFNPFGEINDVNVIDLSDFFLVVTDYNDPNNSKTIHEIPLSSLTDMGYNEYRVITSPDDGNSPLVIDPNAEVLVGDPNFVLSDGYNVWQDPNTLIFEVNDANIVNAYNVTIQRQVGAKRIYLDRQLVYKPWVRFIDGIDEPRYFGRDFDLANSDWEHVVYSQARDVNSILGQHNSNAMSPKPNIDIALPFGTNKELVTVGDVARIWTIGPKDKLLDPNNTAIYDAGSMDVSNPNDPNGMFSLYDPYLRTVGETLRFISETKDANDYEELMRINLADPDYRRLFQYITVFDPTNYGRVPSETRVKGRININTAPQFVIAQLPWMNNDIAQSIVAFRDKSGLGDPNYSDSDPNNPDGRYLACTGKINSRYDIGDIREELGFESTGELNFVLLAASIDDSNNIRYWIRGFENGIDLAGYPDLTPGGTIGDEAIDDYEERDVIFSRISNLVTVRSDVFTAYILVRIGIDGPQKRVVAILDRSQVRNANDKVRILMIHPVPDPR